MLDPMEIPDQYRQHQPERRTQVGHCKPNLESRTRVRTVLARASSRVQRNSCFGVKDGKSQSGSRSRGSPEVRTPDWPGPRCVPRISLRCTNHELGRQPNGGSGFTKDAHPPYLEAGWIEVAELPRSWGVAATSERCLFSGHHCSDGSRRSSTAVPSGGHWFESPWVDPRSLEPLTFVGPPVCLGTAGPRVGTDQNTVLSVSRDCIGARATRGHPQEVLYADV